ncbi:L-seryl-tRNA(Sec) selenium transferase [Streptomyces hyderabadensis]|uniref:L-seryl-tRNA(Sec) selenium transferase n=1 Tax=Streptomyces hyderabadensis TaxID=598549 RepID=A0ABP9IQS4_9ACTN|nr:L-seryl-tRNA(Sec) selenium transferase [Streptomyces hyderabadensis]
MSTAANSQDSPAPDPRRRVPRTDAVLADPRVAPLRARLHPDVVKRQVQRAQQRARAGELPPEEVAEAVVQALPADGCSMRPVLNATGVVLHTNLGRAPLSPAAVRALTVAAGYVDVEFDTGNGSRARRGRAALDALLARVPRAEDALVVNNGAAALVLAASALARDREIVVSRGELVEIGDGFRIPELLESTGARLREVGTTNRTHLADYRAAVGPRTGFVLKIHPSNFLVQGFTSSVPVRDLAGLGVPVVADIGSGLLSPEPLLPDEPDAAGWLAQGAGLVTASGDKLLGGPQAGLVLGRAELVHALRRHPLARALRVDKLTLAALEATVSDGATVTEHALRADPGRLRRRAEALAAELAAGGLTAPVVPSDGLVGGGGAPGLTLPGWAVELPAHLAAVLRHGDPCVVARVDDGRCLLDPRCVPDGEDERLARAVLAAASRAPEGGPSCM